MNLRLKYLPKMKILNFLLTFIYPKTCMSCNTLLNYNTKIELCDNCAKDFNPYRGNRCITCDRPIDNTILANVAFVKVKKYTLKKVIVFIHMLVL